MANSNWSILVDVELNAKNIQQQLNAIDTGKIGSIPAATHQASMGMNDLALSVDAAGKVFSNAKEIINSFVEQVYELNAAEIEFQKVSDLSGDSLDRYVDKLSKAGQSVARTGKPNRSEPVCRDGKVA